MTVVAPESINPLELPSLPLESRRELSPCPAIYFVLKGEQVLYIGRTVNLNKRWRKHAKLRQLKSYTGHIHIAWLECNDISLLSSIEIALINFFQPELNGHSPNPNERIALIRRQLGLTQRRLAEAIGVTDQSVCNWERGVYPPTLTPEQTLALCKVFQCSLEELVKITKNET